MTHWALRQASVSWVSSCGVLADQLACVAQKASCDMYLLNAVDQSPVSGWPWMISIALLHKQQWRLNWRALWEPQKRNIHTNGWNPSIEIKRGEPARTSSRPALVSLCLHFSACHFSLGFLFYWRGFNIAKMLRVYVLPFLATTELALFPQASSTF